MNMSIIRKGVILAACLTAMGAWTVTSKAASQSFKVTLNGAQQVPPVQTAATGTAELTYDPATGPGPSATAACRGRPPWRTSTARQRRARTVRR